MAPIDQIKAQALQSFNLNINNEAEIAESTIGLQEIPD